MQGGSFAANLRAGGKHPAGPPAALPRRRYYLSLIDTAPTAEEAEARRLAVLRDYAIIDTPPEEEFDAIVELAASVCQVPVALITLIAEDRQWFKAKIGVDVDGTKRSDSFCIHAIAPPRLLVVPDATLDPRFVDNVDVVGDAHYRFYAGAPLVTEEGVALGTICVLDRTPRVLDPAQLRMLESLGRQAVAHMRLRREIRERIEAEQEVRKRAEHFELLFTSNPLPMWVYDLETLRFTAVNDAAIQQYGYSEDEFLAMTIRDIRDESEQERLDHVLTEIREGKAHPKRWQHRRKTGETMLMEISASNFESDGRHRRLVLANDVTAAVHAEEAAQASTKRLITTFETLGDAFYSLDEGFHFTYVNSAAEKLLSRTREDLQGKCIWDEFPAVNATIVRPAIERAFRDQVPVRLDDYYSERYERWMEINLHPSAQGVAVYLRDVTSEQAARQQLKLLDSAITRLNDMVLITDADSIDEPGPRILFVNDAFTRQTGYTSDEVAGKSPRMLQGPKTDRATLDRIRTALQAQQPVHEELINYTKDGRAYWLELDITPITGASGAVTHFVSVQRDITQRRESVETIRFSEERFRLLSKATNDAIWDWDLVTDTLWWNEGYYTLFGHRRSTTPADSSSWKNFIHHADYGRVISGIQQVIDGITQSWSDEYRFQRTDGTYAYVLDRGHVIRDASGRAVRVIGGMTDLTTRRAAEDRIAQQAALLDKAQDAILVRDLDHRILYWNKSAERVYGWTAAEAIGRTVLELLCLDRTVFEAALTTLYNEDDWVGEIRQSAKDGRVLTVQSRWTLVRDESGHPSAVLAINTDITERRRMEQQFLRAQRLESIGTLAGGIAHDLNNVLAPMLMSVELLKLLMPTEEAAEILQTLQSSGERGAQLVRQVLTFARGVEGQRVVVNPLLLIREIEKIIGDTFPKSIDFRFLPGRDLWTVTGDPTQLHQVLLNLCVNARDAMPEGGNLTLTIDNTVLDDVYAGMNPESHPGSYIVVKVTDTGTGIAPANLDRIFEPFFTTKELGRGTGLGLSTTLAIVKSHGGFINVYSEIGRGTTFKIYLAANTTEHAAEEAAIVQTGLPRGNGELLLIVDDEESIRNVAKKTLERFGYRVMLACHGAEAVGLYAEHRRDIALVLTDMAMPIMDGPALIVALKAMNPDVLIVASSGLTANGGVAKALGAGVAHFVPKPYTAETMLRILNDALTARIAS